MTGVQTCALPIWDIILDEGASRLKAAPEHAAALKPYVGKEVVFGIRPEDLPYDEANAPSSVKTTISVVEPLGAEIHLWAQTSSHQVVSRVPPHHNFRIGESVSFSPVMAMVCYFALDTEKAILPVDYVEGQS